MAHNERNNPDPVTDESADTASFQRFVEQSDPAPTATDGARSFRLLSLLVGAIVLVVLVILLLQ